MSLIYHPMAKTYPMNKSIDPRIDDGCLTPQNQHLENKPDNSSFTHHHHHNISQSIKLDMLSPPLSPYQRTEVSIDKSVIKSYLPNKPYNLENYKSYELKLNPWSDLKNYKSNQFKFLNKYSIIKKRESQERSTKERVVRKRKYNTNSFMDQNSDSNSNEDNKVRTRRIMKESNNDLSDKSAAPASPRKKKTNIQQQQQSFIDENIPDYSPSTDTLPNNAKCLKIDWKGQPMDLSDDPNADKLHPGEVTLASILRLPCNVYLDSKRRLFYEKVNRFKAGMQFRRTDAQKACRIDVNKASRLFAAFEKVGWLEDYHFEKYL